MPPGHPRVRDEDEIVLVLVTALAGQDDAVRVSERHSHQFRLRPAERAHSRHGVRAAHVPWIHPQAGGAVTAGAVEADTAVDMRRQHDPVTAPDTLHGRTDGLDRP